MSGESMLLGNRYEIGRLLGRGGMAEVYLARDTRLNRTVAVKVLRSDLARDEHFQERFRREAQSAAGLNHPSIVAVHDTGEDHRTEASGEEVTIPFIVMEYVEGETLRPFISADAPLSEARASDIMAGILGALEYSHRSGIVHRDIKPGNIMITKSNQVKVMDFGIARAVAESTAAMTQTSAVMGTAQYLSPEQARGQQVDARSDVYSAAVVLYELLTGRPPFTGESPVSIAYQHVRETPLPPSTYNPNISKAMDAVVLHGLAKDREARYQSAAEFQKDIAAAAAGREPQALAAAGAATLAAEAATQRLDPRDYPTEVFQDQATQVIPTHTAPLAPAPAASVQQSAPVAVVEEEEKKRPLFPWILAAITVLAVLAVAAWWFMVGANRESETVAVPNVVGALEAEAKSTLEAQGLVPKFEEQASSDVEDGTVISTNPVAATEVQRGSTITVMVSSGPAEVQVPPLVGLSEADARAALEKVGLTLKVEGTKEFADLEKGQVGEMSPSPGSSATEGDEVSVYLASGAVAIPNVVGMSQEDATKALEDAGFSVDVLTREAGDGQSVGEVIEQSPTADTTAEPGSGVQIVVAGEAAPVTIPNVEGLTLEDAQSRLSDPELGLGHRIGYEYSDTVEEGRVIGTNPAANEEVPKGSTIVIIVSNGPDPASQTPSPTPSDSPSTEPTTPAPSSTPPGNGNGNGNGGGNNGGGTGNGNR